MLYDSNPKRCKLCNSALSYEERTKVFCSSSCSASFNNKGRIRSLSSKLKTSISCKKKYKQSPKRLKNKVKAIECCVCKNIFNWTKSYKRTTCSEKCYKEKIGSSSRANPKCGGFRLSKKQGGWYFSQHQSKKVFLDSSWEVKYAEWLDKNNVKWMRPKFLKWIDKDNKERRYTPDFYLIELKEYVDVKNDFLLNLESTKDKITRVETQYNIKIKIITKQILNALCV